MQAWSNVRNLASLSPAQQQHVARNQQLLAQQYIFQQAMFRNPQVLMQAQSIRLAQMQQQALQQQQQQMLSAVIGTVSSAVTASTSQSGSKLLITMAGGDSSTTASVALPYMTASTMATASTHGAPNTVAGDGGGVKYGCKSYQSNGVEGQSTNAMRGSGHITGSSQAAEQPNSTTQTTGESLHHQSRTKTAAKSKTAAPGAYSSTTSGDRKSRQKLNK